MALGISLLGLSSMMHVALASEPPVAAGCLENSAAWFTAEDSSRPVEALGKDLHVDGWVFFGSDHMAETFGDTSQRNESLPAYVQGLAVASGAKTARVAFYARIPVPDASAEHFGTLTLIGVEGTPELLSFRIGSSPPPIVRVAVLVDNLGTDFGYAPRGLRLDVNGVEGSPVAASPDGEPDWVFWDLKGVKEGDEVSLSVQPSQGVAAVGGLVFLSGTPGVERRALAAGVLPVIDRKVGEFSRDGEYVKDYYVFREGDTYHLFYNVGTAAEVQNWEQPGNEKAFGHATSKDLKSWEHHPRILPVVPGTWEGEVVSAPSIIKRDGTYYMFYTGFDDRVKGKQSIGLATSKDLFSWERHAGNPVYEAPPWTARNPNGWIDCRDAHVMKYGDEFLMFTMVTTAAGQGAIAVASSPDLVTWTDLGPAVVTFTTPESPRVFEHGGNYYMFASSAHGKELFRTTNPKTGPWESIPFCWPGPGLWSGWEVTDYDKRTIFSAFEWKMNGNLIRFWDVRWNDAIPSAVY
jgi:beta-fructofuranosidase